MTAFISRLRGNTWGHWLFALSLPIVFTLIPALAVKLIFHRTTKEIMGLYLAFMAPQVLSLLSFGLINKWADGGASPKRVAIASSLCIFLFMTAILGATLYSGVALHLIETDDVIGVFILAEVGGGLAAFFNHPKMLENANARRSQRQV